MMKKLTAVLLLTAMTTGLAACGSNKGAGTNTDKKSVTEKILQRLILEDIPSFLKELGDGFTFVENEYKIKIGNTFNYIDLLLYNIKFNCYVVIELKVTELKKEHIGQIQIYMNYVDKNIKTINQDKVYNGC